jgi:hypothetical protein
LQSLAAQTDNRFKVYIGNDDSPEDPSALLAKYNGKFDFVYHRFDTNLGRKSLVQQWHRCISTIQNEQWLVVLGDDDVVQDNFVATFYENLPVIEVLNIAVIRYATAVINEKGEEISKVHTHPRLETSADFLMRKFKGGTRSSLSEFIFRRIEFDKVKFKDLPLAWYSDYLAVLEVSNFSTLFTINNSLVYFRHSGLNITSQNNNLRAKNFATFGFYYYLISEKKRFFDAEQINILMDKLEKSFLDDKKNFYFWIKTTKYYFLNFYYKRYGLFLNKLVQSVCKKHKL